MRFIKLICCLYVATVIRVVCSGLYLCMYFALFALRLCIGCGCLFVFDASFIVICIIHHTYAMDYGLWRVDY